MRIKHEVKWIDLYNAKKISKLEVIKSKLGIIPNINSINNTEGI
jgi:hypothetical protein